MANFGGLELRGVKFSIDIEELVVKEIKDDSSLIKNIDTISRTMATTIATELMKSLPGIREK